MKLKKLTLLIGFSLLLASCSKFTGSNIDTRKTNLVLNDYENDKKVKEDILSTENEDISSILNKNKEEYDKIQPKGSIDVDVWKKKLVDIGQFDQEFVDGLAKERIKDLVKEAEDLSEKTGYWDVKDFVFQQLAKDFPDTSEKFPLDSIEPIYDWEISDDNENTDMYQDERASLEENGFDSTKVYELPNNVLKDAFKKAYAENEDGLYNDYINAVYEILSDDTSEE